MGVRAGVLSSIRAVAEPHEPLGFASRSASTNGDGPRLSQGLRALTVIARLHHVPSDAAGLLHQLGRSGANAATIGDLLLACKHLGLRAKRVKTTASRLPLTPLPA